MKPTNTGRDTDGISVSGQRPAAESATSPPATSPEASPRARGVEGPGEFVLYVEGPRDREILSTWARGVSRRLARRLEGRAVILGGRQPARALAHFRELGGREGGTRAICVLDRDDDRSRPTESAEPGLEFFTWPRRHIESYLLVPDAIRRCLRLSDQDPLADRLLREHIPEPHDEQRLKRIDAKRLLASTGPLTRALGQPLRPGRIARSMREAELHPDVVGLLERLSLGLGVTIRTRPIIHRPAR